MSSSKPKSHRAPARNSAESVVQSDLALNLFMVLMVVLAILTATTAAITTIGFKVNMTPEQAVSDAPMGLVASWQPVLPILPRIVVRDGMVQRLDIDPLAESFLNERPFLSILNYTGRPDRDPDPSAYKVDLDLQKDPVPSEIVAWRIPATALAHDAVETAAREAFETDVSRFEQFHIFVYPRHEEAAWDLIARLGKANKRYRVAFIEEGGRLGFERASDRFTFEDMYK